ncbi:hypothetical protein SLEP1_g2554 [Rubroshorea leprosula]|uniref:RING-type domain-containing protein n=1 Tax=Rubroshorea leprosula TaxID=152421 RepID=A0AAV5HTC9_9ROSI|nr:hypothetical protein SLEP1_g2554 [Rubroshorea leprosula]
MVTTVDWPAKAHNEFEGFVLFCPVPGTGARMMASGMNLITTIIGFAMSATFIVFVCTRIICGRIRGTRSERMFDTESRIDVEQPGQRIRGLEPVLVAAIPTMLFSRDTFSSLEDALCSICLGEYQEKEELRIMPKCGHNFHLACIDVWLRKQTTCPVCRFPLHNLFEAKNLRSATLRMPRTQSMDTPETSMEHPRQLLIPGPERSVGYETGQGHPDSVTGETQGRH